MKALIAPSWDRWTYGALVASIHDGDTVRASVDLGFEIRSTWTLRLLGIQCPEVGGPNVSADEKAAGIRAREALADLLDGGAVVVRTKRDTQEGRGRYLATLYVVQPDGQWLDVCQQLVLDGHAVAYDGKGKAPKWTPEGWRVAV